MITSFFPEIPGTVGILTDRQVRGLARTSQAKEEFT